MDGNGEAAGHFQLKVGGSYIRFAGTVVQVEHSKKNYVKWSETVVSPLPFQIFNRSLPSLETLNCSTNSFFKIRFQVRNMMKRVHPDGPTSFL